MTIPATTISDYPAVGSVVWLSARDDGAIALRNLTYAIYMTEGISHFSILSCNAVSDKDAMLAARSFTSVVDVFVSGGGEAAPCC